MIEKITIPAYRDIELDESRDKGTSFILETPKNGINNETGIILLIGGFLAKPNSYTISKDYTQEDDSLSSMYNCIVVNVEYFGVYLTGIDGVLGVNLCNNFHLYIKHFFNIDKEEYFQGNIVNLEILAKILLSKGIHELPKECFFYGVDNNNEYQSWGLMPAIDYINALSYVLKKFPQINKSKIIISGISYGGYIGALLSKFMPRTFSLIIDNSSFINSDMKYINREELSLFQEMNFFGLKANYCVKPKWTIMDETKPNYFSDFRKSIRSLLNRDHFTNSDATHYIFHADEDEMVPIEQKEKYVSILRKVANVNYYKITKKLVDGKIFKHNRHFMDTDTRKLFDKVFELNNGILEKDNTLTDFDLNIRYSFDYYEKSYNFEYTEDYKFKIWINE